MLRITQMHRAGHLAGGPDAYERIILHVGSRTLALMQRRQFSRLHAVHVQPSAFIFGHHLPRISIVELRFVRRRFRALRFLIDDRQFHF